MSLAGQPYHQIARALSEDLGQDLVGCALFGSHARGDNGPGSDVDLFVVARGLPAGPWERQVALRQALARHSTPMASFVAVTPEEFEQQFPSYYLDLGLDARILHDPSNYLGQRLSRIREITQQSGLRRTGSKKRFGWRWDTRPKGNWEITWEGFRELAYR